MTVEGKNTTAQASLRFTTDWVANERASDGTPVRLRLLRPSDGDRLLAGFERLSDESRYRRFFTAMPRLPESVLQRLLDTDGWNHLAIGVETPGEPPEGIGIARFIRIADAPDTADAAVAVVDDMQRRGIGKLLLTALAGAARERGITRFRAEVLRTNEAVQALLHDLGDGVRLASFEGPVAVYELDLPEPTPERPISGALAAVLRLAARGLGVLARRVDAAIASR